MNRDIANANDEPALTCKTPTTRSETSARVGVRSTDAARKTSTKSPNPVEADNTPEVHDIPAAHDTPNDHYIPPSVDPASPEFDPSEALQSLHLDIVDLDALANAANEAVAQVPFPADRKARFASDRAYALVTKVADVARAMSRRSYEMQDALRTYLPRRRAESTGGAR